MYVLYRRCNVHRNVQYHSAANSTLMKTRNWQIIFRREDLKPAYVVFVIKNFHGITVSAPEVRVEYYVERISMLLLISRVVYRECLFRDETFPEFDFC